MTPTRVVDEQFGLRSEVVLADIAALGPRSETLHVTLRYEAEVTRHHLTRRPWCLKAPALDTLDVQTKDLHDGSGGLARELQQRLDTPRRGVGSAVAPPDHDRLAGLGASENRQPVGGRTFSLDERPAPGGEPSRVASSSAWSSSLR